MAQIYKLKIGSVGIKPYFDCHFVKWSSIIANFVMTANEIISYLQAQSSPVGRQGMARFGINPTYALGIRIPVLRALAKQLKKNHPLALELWQSKLHEARILAAFIADPRQLTDQQMEEWLQDFNSWDLCDQCCNSLFVKHATAHAKAKTWASRTAEFEKRAGYSLMAGLAIHAKKLPNAAFEEFFPLIQQGANDSRLMVKKAVSWALRQIGKRNTTLLPLALNTAHEISQQPTPSARWVARETIRELTHPAIITRIKSG
jgi:3-methyladenine DNA glycosylase AlkD